MSRDSDSHIAAVFLFAITQLQALAAQFRNTDAIAARQELTPFINFLTASMTAGARATPTKKRRS